MKETLPLYISETGWMVNLAAKSFKVTICAGFTCQCYWKGYISLNTTSLQWQGTILPAIRALSLPLALMPMDRDEQAGHHCGVYTCQLQEAHLRWQQCHFGTTSSFTPDHTCRWESPKHLWVTRLEEVPGRIGAKGTSWCAEGAWRPWRRTPWQYIKLTHPAWILAVPTQFHKAESNSGTRGRQVGACLLKTRR